MRDSGGCACDDGCYRPGVVELAWRADVDMKIRGNVGKWALREVLYRHVPRELGEGGSG